MGQTKRCEYCHEYVDAAGDDQHVNQHLQLRPDGQQQEYATLPPEERATGDISNEPSVYCHAKCGGRTQMPEEIIRSYLVNPYLYSYLSYCSGCQKHVSMRQLVWEGTNETVIAYTRRLQRENPKRAMFRNRLILNLLDAAAKVGISIGLLVALIIAKNEGFNPAVLPFFGVSFVATFVLFLILVVRRGGI